MRLLIFALACFAMSSLAGWGKEKEKTPPTHKQPAIALYDTVKASAIGESVATFKAQDSWMKIESGKEGVAFTGDAVLVNRKLAAVIKKGGGVDLYAKGKDGWMRRGALAPVVDEKKTALIAILSVAMEGTKVAVKGTLGKGIEVIFSLRSGTPVLKTTAVGKISALRFEAPCRFGVLPDFFADDLVVDATQITVKRTEIPSDNFFLHMLSKGDSILAAVWDKNIRDVELSLEGEGAERKITGTDIFYGKGGSVYAAVLENKGIWHYEEITKEGADKAKKLDNWIVPFMAKWKANFTQENGTIISRPLVTRKGAETFSGIRYQSLNHKLTARPGSKTFFATLQAGRAGYQGPMIAYPIGRFQTPLDQLCIDDLLRECLGLQACAYVLQVESRSAEKRGIFTCSYNKTPDMFILPGPRLDHNRRAAEAWKEDRAFMKNEVQSTMLFIKFIQDRINTYVALRLEILAYLDKAETEFPDQSDFITRLKNEMNKSTPVFKKMIKPNVKATGVQTFQPWMEEMLKSLKIDTPTQSQKGTISKKAKSIGDPQDTRLAGLRKQVKVWRSMATMEMAKKPKAAPIAKEIRARTEAALRNPSNYERPNRW